MSKTFGHQKLTFACSKCGHKFHETIARLETSPNLTCPTCGLVTLVKGGQLRTKLGEVDKALEKLGQTFRKIGKR